MLLLFGVVLHQCDKLFHLLLLLLDLGHDLLLFCSSFSDAWLQTAEQLHRSLTGHTLQSSAHST